MLEQNLMDLDFDVLFSETPEGFPRRNTGSTLRACPCPDHGRKKFPKKPDENHPAKSSSVSPEDKKTRFQKTDKTCRVSLNSLQLYFREINQFELITPEEQRELAIRALESDDKAAAQKLITSNLKLVVKIAKDFQDYGSRNLMDLIQEGNLGLLQAVKHYDPHRGTRFSYYAAFWIKAYILKFIMDTWSLVRIGTSYAQRKLFFNLNKERQRLIAQGINPKPSLLADKFEVTQKDVIEMGVRLAQREISVDAPLSDAQDGHYSDKIPDPAKNAEQCLVEEDSYNHLLDKIMRFRTTLSQRDAFIFDHRIMAEPPLKLQELGDMYGISKERVRQIQDKICDGIKDFLKDSIPGFEKNYPELIYS
jgi:RNA polymerase sigma-32 factor